MKDAFEAFRADVDFMWTMATSSWGCQLLTRGKLDREALAMVTLQMYHYVKRTVAVIDLALARLPRAPEHDDLRQLLEYFAREEDGHERLALRDLAAMGYDPEACQRVLPLPTTLNLQGANQLALEEFGPYYLLGETYATETVGAHVSQSIFDAYRGHPELGGAVSFYRVHGDADQRHAAKSEATLRRHLEVPGRRAPLVLGCLTAWRNLTALAQEIQNHRLYPADFQLPPRG